MPKNHEHGTRLEVRIIQRSRYKIGSSLHRLYPAAVLLSASRTGILSRHSRHIVAQHAEYLHSHNHRALGPVVSHQSPAARILHTSLRHRLPTAFSAPDWARATKHHSVANAHPHTLTVLSLLFLWLFRWLFRMFRFLARGKAYRRVLCSRLVAVLQPLTAVSAAVRLLLRAEAFPKRAGQLPNTPTITKLITTKPNTTSATPTTTKSTTTTLTTTNKPITITNIITTTPTPTEPTHQTQHHQ
ncbi:hypothetical protein EDC01DRAFT_404576 [Geopyxis carbonaria]|nr:hypothetical protein EDC01DRAFT_404576 [Geopyxis carbonaria]